MHSPAAGWILWTLAEHYLYTRDQQFLRTQLPRILKPANWIIQERQATRHTAEGGNRVWERGLLPAGQLEDNEDYQYWYAVNAYAYRGLRTAAKAVSDHGKPLQALRVFYNTLEASFYPDIVALTEWAPTLGKSGGPFYKTSDETAFLT
jgi:hypothetical protein